MGIKVGVYVDAQNIYLNGGASMRYDVLRDFAARGEAEAHIIHLNAYVAYDEHRARKDDDYRQKAQRFHERLRIMGFKVIIKTVRWYKDASGERYGKANADLDLATDCLVQSNNLDHVVLVSGDGDFVRLVRALQNQGCRVEVVAFDNVSRSLREEADMYVSGYLIPGLLPNGNQWGTVGSTVRGVCQHYDHERGFGFIRFLRDVSTGGLWITNRHRADTPYATAFFHRDDLEDSDIADDLPSNEKILEFKLAPSPPESSSDFTAEDVHLVNP